MTSSLSALTGGLPSPLDTLAAALAGGGPAAGPSGPAGEARPAAPATAARPAASKAAPAKTTAKKPAAKKTSTSKASATKAKAAGYATKLPADYAFLRDPKVSIEEKLSRFIGMLMAKSEQDLLRQMEKMAPGSTAAAAGGGGATGTSGAGGAAKPKAAKFSLWGLAKSVIPALNLASQVVGDAQLKKLASQLSGPVLAAACTAVGLPQLAPLAQKYGPQLVGALAKDITLDLGLLTGGGGASGAAAGAGGTVAGAAAKAGGADPATSEKAQLMELQRLQDRDRELFSLFSNMLKAMHDARMTAIQNVR